MVINIFIFFLKIVKRKNFFFLKSGGYITYYWLYNLYTDQKWSAWHVYWRRNRLSKIGLKHVFSLIGLKLLDLQKKNTGMKTF